jgi:hypothetical protein
MSKSRAQRHAEAETLMNELPALKRGAFEFPAGVAENDNRIGAVADRLGRVAAFIAELEDYEKRLKGIIIAHGEDAVEGKLFRATLSIFDQSRLDTKAVKEEMGEAWVAKRSKASKVTKVVSNARKGALADVAA